VKHIQRNIFTFLLLILSTNIIAQADELSVEQHKWDKGVEAVSLDELEQVTGMGGVVDVTTVSNANLEASLANNYAANNINGFNIIDHGAFTEASGVVSVIQNTGNNVIIQDSTIINVTVIH